MILTKNCVIGVHRHLVFGGIADEPLRVREGHVRGCSPVTLVIGDNFDLSMLEYADTGIGGTQINTDCWCFRRHFCRIKEYFFKLTLRARAPRTENQEFLIANVKY